jgi:hypothetical protein
VGFKQVTGAGALLQVHDWLHLLAEVGFTATVRPLEHSAVPPGSTAIFAAHKFRTPRRLTMAG